jgi:hypothetical protein
MRIGLVVAATIVATAGLTQVARDRGPGSPGDRAGKPFRTATDTTRPPSQRPLRVDTFHVQRVGPGSGLGAAGDLLITFRGEGFMLTSRAPRVQLTGDFALEGTEVNRDGTELFVLVPRTQLSRIQGMRFDSVVVANPGSRRETPFAGIAVRATAARLLRPDPDAPVVRLVYRDGAFSREALP